MDGQDGCNDSDLAYRESPGDRKYSKAWGQTDQELEQPNLAGFFGTEFSDEELGPPTEIMKNNATYCFGPAQGLELAPFGADFLEKKKAAPKGRISEIGKRIIEVRNRTRSCRPASAPKLCICICIRHQILVVFSANTISIWRHQILES